MRKSYRKHWCAVILAHAGMISAFAHGDHMGFDDLLIGKAGDPQSVTRTIHIDMSDEMRFTPDNITAEKNETIRLVIANRGKVPHEFMLGTARRLKEQNERLKSNPEARRDAPYRLSLKPGEAGEIVWKFSQAGAIGFACFQPGHFDGGMKGDIMVTVEAPKPAQQSNVSVH